LKIFKKYFLENYVDKRDIKDYNNDNQYHLRRKERKCGTRNREI
jgi:hypothetical protein